MSYYKVEKVELRKGKKGDKFLQLQLNDTTIAFFEEKDMVVKVTEGDIVSCKIERKGKYYNGTDLKVANNDLKKEIKIEKKIKIENKPEKRGNGTPGWKHEDSDMKLHAGARIYFFDVKTTSRGDKYLVVNEQSGDKRNRIFIFEDHADEFSEKLEKNLKKLKEK